MADHGRAFISTTCTRPTGVSGRPGPCHRAPAPTRVRAQASIDHNTHMVGRVGRFRLESDEPAERGGHSAQTLRAAVPVRLRARLNGDQLGPWR